MDSFAQYNTAARRLRDLPTASPTQKQLQQAVFQQATNFLHEHMLPLRTLPQTMKHASAYGLGSAERPSPNGKPNGKPNGAITLIQNNEAEAASQANSTSAISHLEAEEKALRERLMVLEEQLFLVKEQIVDANKRRKFDEVSSLAQNVDDLEREINEAQGQLAQLDFAGLYSDAAIQHDGLPAR